MRAYLACCVLAALPSFAGCFPASSSGDDEPINDVCSVEPTFTVDTGATITHVAGEDPGYYAEYDGSGAWHFEWTCDTKLSAEGCIFSGSIVAPTPAGGINASCYECESNDELSTQPNGNNTEIDFNTVTTTGIDGVDFTTTPGATIEIDFQINGIDQDNLVFIPSNGAAVSPTCMPVQLSPSAP